jgi:hypothetical protein
MEFKDLDTAEKAVIRSLQRLAHRWPKTLRLVAVGGGLTVAYSDGEQPDQPVTYISGIPLGGERDRKSGVRYWLYEFSVRQKDEHLRQEAAIQLFTRTATLDRQRLTFTGEQWEKFRESAERSGLSLYDVYRRPVMPAELIV